MILRFICQAEKLRGKIKRRKKEEKGRKARVIISF